MAIRLPFLRREILQHLDKVRLLRGDLDLPHDLQVVEGCGALGMAIEGDGE